MGKISDIWVRLGLKKNEYDKGMDDAGKKAEGFGATLGKMKAGALAVWAAIGASVVGFAKQMLDATNRVGDAWQMFVAKADAGWRTFVQNLSNMSLDGLISKIRDARRAAEELQSALDAEYEATNSIRLQKAAMEDELAQLELLARNASKPYEERAKAAQEYLDKVKPIYDQELALANRLLDAQQGRWLAGTGLTDNDQTRKDLAKFLVDYGKDQELADTIARMREIQKDYEIAMSTRMAKGDYVTKSPVIEEYQALREIVKGFAQNNGYKTDIYKLAQVYENLRADADTTPLVDALIRAGLAAGAFNKQTKRMQQALNTATVMLETATEELNEAVERQDLSLPTVTPITGMAETSLPDMTSAREWLDQYAQIGQEAVDKQAEWISIMQEGAMMLEETLISSLGNGLQAITDLMFGLDGASAKNILAAFMAPFGDFAKQMGSMIMSYGISMEAFKKAFSNPYVAIAAGAGLMAIGAAISSGAQKLSTGSLSGSPTSSYGSSSYNNELNNYESTLTVYVEGRISGSDIIIAGTNQQNKWDR